MSYVTDRQFAALLISFEGLVICTVPFFLIRPLSGGGDTSAIGIVLTTVATVVIAVAIGLYIYFGVRRTAYIVTNGTLSKRDGLRRRTTHIAQLSEIDRVQIDAHVAHGSPKRLVVWSGGHPAFVSLHAIAPEAEPRLLQAFAAAGLQPASPGWPYPLLRDR